MLRILVIESVEDFVVTLHAAVEAYPVLLRSGQPANLSDGEHTGKELIFYLVDVVGSFSPHVTLHTKGEVFLTIQRAEGIEAVDFLNGIHTPATMVEFIYETVVFICLHEVKIQVAVRNDDRLHATLCRFGALANTVPRHHNRLSFVVVIPV